MDKAVLLSVSPYDCEEILKKKLNFVILKTKTRMKVPFKCYIYCRKAKLGKAEELLYVGNFFSKEYQLCNQKIVGEFICDNIEQVCTPLFNWHISDLKIYDKPKELSEFRKPCDHFIDCYTTCKRKDRKTNLACQGEIKYPPKCWCYVKEL